MDTNTSGEEFLTKARKPYTITKQRERWTEDEHDRFIEALGLYGRAWQRIEEHIGTKTAIQIRSHAQKFFTKLEKEADAKGIPVCQALDINIPPPRPKRKPVTPYPRKPENNGASSSHLSSAKDGKLVSSASSSHINHAFLDLEKLPAPEESLSGKENQDDNCSGVSTVNKYPLPKKVTHTFMESEPSLTKASGDNGTRNTSDVDNTVQDLREKNKEKDGDAMHNAHNHPWHFLEDNVTKNTAKCTSFHPPGMVSPDFMFRPMGDRVHVHSSLNVNLPAATTTTSSVTTTTSQHAFPACPSQDDYRSFLQISSAFSNLIMSTLVQNPAAHAAATFAASVWPYANVGNSGDSSTQMSSSPPSIAAIAAATVAAATAWWASHGLVQVCAPPPVTCLPLPTFAVPTPAKDTMDTVEKQSTALQDKNLASSSDYSEETGITKLNTDSKTNGDKEEFVALNDSDVAQKKKLVDRSSCGSNTPSGSDLETDALDKMEKDKENVQETVANQQSATELSNRRSKIRESNNNNNNNNYNNNPTTDSWKEVSHGGRIAFEALFARERLPQSFSPSQVEENVNGKQRDTSKAMDLNYKIQDSGEVSIGKSLKTRQTGFKPYKRCSMEEKESQVGNTNNQSDEQVCKRLRLEEEAST